jgi:hypothetical protein
MYNYIKLDGNKIINWYQTTTEKADTSISITEYKKLVYSDDAYFTYENKKVVSNPLTTEMQAEKDKTDALIELQITDGEVPRVLEDIYDALPEEVKANIPQETKDKIQNKKTKRAEYLALL